MHFVFWAVAIVTWTATGQAGAVAWQSRHGMSAVDYQNEFNQWTQAPYNYRLISVCGYEQGGQARFAAVWAEQASPAWTTHPQLTKAQFDSYRTILAAHGYYPVFISAFGVGSAAYYNAIWEYAPGADVVSEVELSAAAYATRHADLSSQGYKLVHLWTCNAGASEYFAAVWRRGVTESYAAYVRQSAATFQSQFNSLASQGYQLAVVSSAVVGGQPLYSSVWKKPANAAWYCTPDLSEINYAAETSNWTYQGYRPVLASAFVTAAGVRFHLIVEHNGGLAPSSLATINNAITNYMAMNLIPGLSLAISRQGRLVYAKGFGEADVSTHERVHPGNRFRIASVSKTITAAALLKLRDNCELDLDEPVFGAGRVLGTYFGTQPYTSSERAITTRQLLWHTSGWTNDSIWDESAGSDPYLAVSHQLDNYDPVYSPGTYFTYLNINFCTAARVLELRRNVFYDQFVKDELLAPSCVTDMEIGGNGLPDRKPGEVVYYPSVINGKLFDPYALNLQRMDANGGWIARPLDLLLFLRRIDGDSTQADLLQTSSFNEMHAPSGTPNGGKGYGLGLIVNPIGGPVRSGEWGHNGAMAGTIAFLIHRDDGMAFAFACNIRPPTDAFAGGLRSVVDSLIDTLSSAKAWPDYDLFACSTPPGDPSLGLAASRSVYVDWASSCAVPNGQPTCSFVGGPFPTVSAGLGFSCAADALVLHTGSYNERPSFVRRMTLQPSGGPVTIGR